MFTQKIIVPIPRKFCLYLINLLLLLFATEVCADVPISAFHDTNTPALPIQAIIEADFRPVTGTRVARKGITWLKIDLSRQDKQTAVASRKQLRYFINDYTGSVYETLYLVKDDKVIDTYFSGYLRPFSIRPIAYHKFVVAVGEAYYLLFTNSSINSNMPLMMRIISEAEFRQEFVNEKIMFAAVYAIVVAMLFYNFFIYLFLREKRYFYYCLYLLAMLFTQMRLSGLGKQYFWPNMVEDVKTLYVFNTVIVSIAGVLFYSHFFDQQSRPTFNRRLVNGTIMLTSLTFVAYLFKSISPLFHQIAIIGSQVMLIANFFVIYYLIFSNGRKSGQMGAILILTYTVINVASLIALARYHALVKNNFLIEHAIEIAVVFEAIALSLVLANKIRDLRYGKIAAELKHTKAQQHFSKQLLHTQENEKKALGSALHDNFTHELLVVKKEIEVLCGEKTPIPKKINKILNDMRNLSHIIHPHTLEKLGLKVAIEEMISKIVTSHDIEINYAIRCPNLLEEQSILVYRIVQEALNNVIKHAQATECLVIINSPSHNTLHITIKDDGIGFDPDSQRQGFGLSTLQERCQMLSGTLQITSNHEGTSITINFPIHIEETI